MPNCKKCGENFESSKGLINYCSMKCRQSKTWTAEAKQLKSENSKKISDDIILQMQTLYLTLESAEKVAKVLNVGLNTVKKYVKLKKQKNYWTGKNPLAPIERKRKLKQQLVEYKGGKCCLCGYDKSMRSLHFHHLDEKTKEFDVTSKGYNIDRLKKEADKCILVCANCHGEIHEGLINTGELSELD